IYYSSPDEAVAVTPVEFVDPSTGSPADPATVSCVVIDPTGTFTTYTSDGSGPDNLITKVSVGNYTLTLNGLTVSGLYTFTWVGVAPSWQQIYPGTFRLVPLSDVGTGMQYWYTG